MNNKGQSVLSEYVMIFFVVIAAAVALTVYVQRGLEARVHDARNFMITSVVNSGACDANCVTAAGGMIPYQYEPYYAVIFSDVQQNEAKKHTSSTGNPQAIGAIYSNSINEATQTISTSVQLPPCIYGGSNPGWCK